MSYLNRVWMAATAAVAQSHTDPGHRCKTVLKSINQNKTRLFSVGALLVLRPMSGVVVSDVTVSSEAEEKLRRTNDSLQKVMYINCWGQG
ncbi:hypothetical protein TSUD_105150 [Trifolium subterraneum]|uniref:Uncharacterized protein n=1 Tax=Trifolium subterraneum TaxID=3900 RepID=A0A2Z6MGR9_TRISU|nr:hypothetical protein TSUD_105150 [Trifolium subterraneum]